MRTNEDRSTFRLTFRDRNEKRSSLPFQIALYVNLWLLPVWICITIINLDAKYHRLTSVYKGITVAAFLILLLSEGLKLYLGYIGNLAGKIPELASSWLILTFVQLPLETFALFDRTMSSSYSEMFLSLSMVCLFLVEIVTGTVALSNLADRRARRFYLMHLYDTYR